MTKETRKELGNYGISTYDFDEAENNMNKYKKIIKKLDKKISNCEESLKEVKEMSKKYITQFNINEYSAKGHIMSDYMCYLNVWEEDNNRVITNMDDALEIAKERGEEASSKSIYWETQASIEEQALENELLSKKEEERRKEERKKEEEKAKEEKKKGSKK